MAPFLPPSPLQGMLKAPTATRLVLGLTCCLLRAWLILLTGVHMCAYDVTINPGKQVPEVMYCFLCRLAIGHPSEWSCAWGL